MRIMNLTFKTSVCNSELSHRICHSVVARALDLIIEDVRGIWPFSSHAFRENSQDKMSSSDKNVARICLPCMVEVVASTLCHSWDNLLKQSRLRIILCLVVLSRTGEIFHSLSSHVLGILFIWGLQNKEQGTMTCNVWTVDDTMLDRAAGTRRWANVVLMLFHRLRRCPNIETALAHSLVPAGRGNFLDIYCGWCIVFKQTHIMTT